MLSYILNCQSSEARAVVVGCWSEFELAAIRLFHGAPLTADDLSALDRNRGLLNPLSCVRLSAMRRAAAV